MGLARILAREHRAARLPDPALARRPSASCCWPLFGNHESNVEDWWLFALAGLTVLWLVAGEVGIRKKRARRP